MCYKSKFKDTKCSNIVFEYNNGKFFFRQLDLPKETILKIFINNEELTTISCSPTNLNLLVLGYLYRAGIIDGIENIAFFEICKDSGVANIILKHKNFNIQKSKSCCLEDSIFSGSLCEHIKSELTIKPKKLLKYVKLMLKNANNYNKTGGIHTAALCDKNGIILMHEDIDRHNAIDKIVGECLLKKIATNDKIIILTGRINCEVLWRVVKLKIPIVSSLKSPTEAAVRMANKYQITLIGNIQKSKMKLYTYPKRFLL
jgi:FdhD protein